MNGLPRPTEENYGRISKMNFGVPIFGRREHYELLSRIWLTRDVRCLQSFQFHDKPVEVIAMNFLSPLFSSISHYDSESAPTASTGSGASSSHSTDASIKHKSILELSGAEQMWWDDRAMEIAEKREQTQLLAQCGTHANVPHLTTPLDQAEKKKHCPWEQSFFFNSTLQIDVPRNLIRSDHWMLQELNAALQGESTSEAVTGYTPGDPIPFTPFFSQALLTTKNSPKPPSYTNALGCRLSLHHIAPAVSTQFDYPSEPPNPCYSELSYHFDADLLANILHHPLEKITHVPFLVIAIDLCDLTSINYAIWAHHLLIYLHNTASSWPTPDTTVLVMLFNEMSLDHLCITSDQIHAWFANFPFHCEFHSYSSSFILPKDVELSAKNRTLSTLVVPAGAQKPTPQPSTSLQGVDLDTDTPSGETEGPAGDQSPQSSPDNDNLAANLQPLRSPGEEANVELAVALDNLFVSTVQQFHLNELVNFSGWNELHTHREGNRKDVSTLHNVLECRRNDFKIPCPTHHVIRYPLPSHAGTTLPLKSFYKPRDPPRTVFVQASPVIHPPEIVCPGDLPHWCLFDCSYEDIQAPATIFGSFEDNDPDVLSTRTIVVSGQAQQTQQLSQPSTPASPTASNPTPTTTPATTSTTIPISTPAPTAVNSQDIINPYQWSDRDTTHPCATLELQFRPLTYSTVRELTKATIHNPRAFRALPAVIKPWSLGQVTELLNQTNFDFLIQPFSITSTGLNGNTTTTTASKSTNTPTTTNPAKDSDHIRLPFSTQQLNLSPPPSSIHLVKQRLNYIVDSDNQWDDVKTAKGSKATVSQTAMSPYHLHPKNRPFPTTNSLTIGHFPTPSVDPIHQFSTTFVLNREGEMHYLGEGSTINPTSTPYLGQNLNTDPASTLLEIDSAEASSTPMPTPSSSATFSTPTTLFRSHHVQDRFYTISHLDTTTKAVLAQERQSNYDATTSTHRFETSQLLTLHPLHTTDHITKLCQQQPTTATAPPTSTDTGIDTFLPATVTPLSHEPHHIYCKLSDREVPRAEVVPPYQTTFTTVPVPFSLPNLLSFSLLPLSTMVSQINLITQFHVDLQQHLSKSTLRTMLSWFKSAPAAPTFRFATTHLPSSHHFHADPTQPFPASTPSRSPPPQPTSTLPHSPPLHQLSPSPTPTLVSCSVDLIEPSTIHSIPALRGYDPNALSPCSIQQNTSSRLCFDIASLLQTTLTNVPHYQSNLAHRANRNLTPYFLLILDDLGAFSTTPTNPTPVNTPTTATSTSPPPLSSPPTTLPTGLSSNFLQNHNLLGPHASLVNTWLSLQVPLSTGLYDGDIPLHYSFTTVESLPQTLVQCAETAIASRMDYYSSFNPMYR